MITSRTIAPFNRMRFGVDAFFVCVVDCSDMATGLVVGLDAGRVVLVLVPLYDAASNLHRVRHQVHYHIGNPLVVSDVRHGLSRECPRPIETTLFDPGRIFFRHGEKNWYLFVVVIVVIVVVVIVVFDCPTIVRRSFDTGALFRVGYCSLPRLQAI